MSKFLTNASGATLWPKFATKASGSTPMTKIANFDHRSPPKMQVCAGENAWHCKKYSPLVTKVVAVFAFCCLGVGAKKCCPGEVTVHVIKALASRTHLASTHPLLHLHCTDLKRHCSSGNRCPLSEQSVDQMGPFAPPLLLVLLARPLFPVVRLGD